MTYSVGKSGVTDYANTSSGKVTNVVADDGIGGSGVVVNVVDRTVLSFDIATDVQYPTINVSAIPGYIAGKTDVVITVGADVYVYGYTFTQNNASVYNPVASPFSATMNIIGGTAGDTIKLVNNGYILGAGGDGGGAVSGSSGVGCCCLYYYNWVTRQSTPGGAAIEITYPLILENNGYIAGGGGGGAFVSDYSFNYSVMGGGGGAGGGVGFNTVGVPAGRAIPPNIGYQGSLYQGLYGPCACQTSFFISGGGGGFVLPGDGGLAQFATSVSVGNGGGSGGAGSALDISGASHTYTNNGGTAGGAAPTNYTKFDDAMQGGGGGGWGASGAQSVVGNTTVTVGSPGGNSIITNGNAITTITAGTQYGSLRTTGTTYVETISTSSTSTTYVTIPLGYTDAIIIVPTGVVLAHDDSVNSALFVSAELNGFGNSDVLRLKIIVNGAIVGKGGAGGSEASAPDFGGPAITIDAYAIGQSVTIDCTYGYVAGGGGGGGYVLWASGFTHYIYGGGGAGGGNSGNNSSVNIAYGATTVNTSGNNGSTFPSGSNRYISGGGGGLIVPGTSASLGAKNTEAAFPGIGGSGGGSGAAVKSTPIATTFTNNGGGFNVNGGTQSSAPNQATGGGGGGWGASGGSSKRQSTIIQAGDVGGAAINTQIGLPVYVINQANFAGPVF
jgi:hypothetical protein